MTFQTPVIRSSFIGRDDDLTALESALQHPNTRLVTITGPGGVGKTRLATELAAVVSAMYPGGTWVVPVAHVQQPELVLAEVAAALGIRDLDAKETFERVAERLGGAPTLLVIDNLEQVACCVPIIAQLLHMCARLAILTTSRQPLQLQGEIEYPLRPLRTTEEGESESPAEQLFLLRAREASYGFVATDENREAIKQIAHRLQGIPLAIELAASWVKVLPPRRLLENLDRQLDVLVRGPIDLPERQQTMRSAISWSYHLLTPAEQALFRQLSVFEGVFTLNDAEAISGPGTGSIQGEWPDPAVLEDLASLVTKSLVQVSDDSVDPVEPEYGMLEIIRAFAFEQLAEKGNAAALRDRQLAHFADLAERWSAELSGPNRDLRLAQFDREYPNFRAALAWAAESNQPTGGLRLIAALWRYWDWRGLHAEGARWCDQLLEIGGEIDPILRSNGLYAGAAIAFMQANYPRSMALAELCLATAELTGDDLAISRGLLALGNTTYDRGDLERAGVIYRRSLDLARTVGEPLALQVALVNLGFVRYQEGAFDEARPLFEEACAMEDRTGAGSATEWAQTGLAQVEFRLGETSAAEERLRAVIDRQRVADTGQLGAALLVLATLLRLDERLEEAQALGRESLANRTHREERAFITDSLVEMASLALAMGSLVDGVILAAAVASQRNRIGYGLPDRAWVAQQDVLSSTRIALGSAQYDSAWSKGERLSFAETIEFAEQLCFAPQPAARPPAPAADSAMLPLTRREAEVLRLIVDGKTDREIANALSISSGTASRHVANILHKLDVRTRSAAAAWAIRHGLS